MKTIKGLFIFSFLCILVSGTEAYDEVDPYPEYQQEMYINEGDLNSELYPPTDDYYLAEELEAQEDLPYPEEESETYDLGHEEYPTDSYDY